MFVDCSIKPTKSSMFEEFTCRFKSMLPFFARTGFMMRSRASMFLPLMHMSSEDLFFSSSFIGFSCSISGLLMLKVFKEDLAL